MGCCSFLPAGSGALKIVGIAFPFPPSQHVNTCHLFTKHLPLLQHPPKHRLWDGSTSFHQGWGWLPFSNVPLHCKRADDILLGFQRTGTYWKLQDSRCSALVANSSRCYIGEMMYQSLGISPCCDIMVGHNSSSCASTCNLSCASHPLRCDLGQLRPWGEDVSHWQEQQTDQQRVGDFGWEVEVQRSLRLPRVDVPPREQYVEPAGCAAAGDPKDSQNCARVMS